MNAAILEFYDMLRKIFGLCPHCQSLFRLSDCKLYQKKKPETDWKELLDKEINRLDDLEYKLSEKIKAQREKARESGRKYADRHVRKIDKVFAPLKLNPNDAKVIFNPVDFIVFNGMNANYNNTGIKEILLLDSINKKGANRNVQKSVEKAITRNNFEWLTLRITQDGNIKEEC